MVTVKRIPMNNDLDTLITELYPYNISDSLGDDLLRSRYDVLMSLPLYMCEYLEELYD